MAVFEAFEPSVVVDEFARKIDALCVWNDTLIAGLSDGSLLFFNEQSIHDGSGTAISTWQVTRVQKSFCKRGILQLQALDNQPYLLSLSDADGVQLHSLPELQLVSAASRTSRGSAFSWDAGRQLLVTAIKRKVVSHQLDSEHSFLEMTEYNLPEPVLAISWAGSNILLGTAKSYWLIVPAASQSVEVLPGQVMTIYPAVQPQLLFAAGASHPPVMARLPSGEVLITKDTVSYFLGPDGKPSRKTTLTWSQPPTALIATRLYVAALLPAAVEVKSVSRGGGAAAEQMLLLPDMAVTVPSPASDGCIYIASSKDSGIRQLKPVPLERQAKLLAAAGDFQGALELLTLLENEEAAEEVERASGVCSPASRRQQLEDVLRLRFGYHLFEAGEPDEALTQFSMCSDPDPLLLLRLYPSLVPEKFVPLLPTSAYGEPLPELPAAAGAAAAAAGSTGSTAAGGAESASSSSGSATKRSSSSSSSSSGVDAAAIAVVVPYLLSHRTRLLASLEEAAAASSSSSNNQQQHLDGTSSNAQRNGESAHSSRRPGRSSSSSSSDVVYAAAAAAAAATSSSSNGSSKQRSIQELQLIATVIDTAILRAMLLQPDSGALLRLLQQVNYVDLEDGEAVLSASGRYAELAALYQYNKRHDKGLALLQELSQAPEEMTVKPRGAAADLNGLPGVWAAVRYLVAMQPQDLQLLVLHAGWILASDPEAGLEALLAMNPPLRPELVMPLLQSHAPTYTAVYLESALDLGLVSPGEVHSELLLIYLHMALEEEREGEKSSVAHARQLSLSDLLVSRPHQPLKLFPDDKSQWGAPRTSIAGTAGETAGGTAGDTGGDTNRDSRTARPLSPALTSAALTDPHHPDRYRDAYQRLRELVYASDFIDPEYVLSKLGQGQLLEIRALMLERLGRHREALSVYIHDLAAMKLAEEYCDRVYEAGLAAAAAGAGPGVGPVGGTGTTSEWDGTTGGTAAEGDSDGSSAAGGDQGGTSGDAAAGRPGEWVPAMGSGGSWSSRLKTIGSSGSIASKGLMSSSPPVAVKRLAGAAAGPSWGRVRPGKQGRLLPGQQQQHGQQQRGRRQQHDQPAWRRNWSALQFGARPHDIYMELVDAVLQGPNQQASSLGAAATAAGAEDQQRRRREQAQVVDHEAWKQLAQILSRKTDRISHLQVLDVLPPQLPLADVAALLSSMVLHNTEQKRNLSVVHALRKAENLMAREDLVKVKQRVVTLTFDRACCICHKRMGGAVSVAYPNGSLAHYLCYKRSTGQQQQQGQPLWETAAVSASVAAAAASGGGGPVWSQQQQQQPQQNGAGWGGALAALAH